MAASGKSDDAFGKAAPYLVAASMVADPGALAAALELAGEGILLLALGGRIVFSSKSARELMRFSADSLDGADFWETVPDEAAQRHQNDSIRALKTAKAFTFVEHNAFEDNWVEYAMAAFGTTVVVRLRDVTERQKLYERIEDSEQRNDALFESNPNPMWIFDTESLRVVAANNAATDFYGYFGDEFVALGVAQLFPEEDRAELAALLPAPGLGARRQVASQVCRNRKKNGEIALVELTGRGLSWKGVNAVLVSVSDVTGRYMADETLMEQNTEITERLARRTRELAQANRELESYNYAMSHDLQSPLHIVDGFAKTLVGRYAGVLDEQGLHYLSRIQASSQRMARMIDDLRMLTRVSRIAINPQPVDAAELCAGIMAILRQREPARSVELEIEATLPVVADRSLLITALTCLLENAWKFTAKKPQAWIRVGLSPAGGADFRTLFVSDNGAGFDEGYSGKLFMPFQRLHSSADFPGTGLGLAIVQRVASRHGGRAWAESTLNSGATFFLSLSLLAPPAAAETVSGGFDG